LDASTWEEEAVEDSEAEEVEEDEEEKDEEEEEDEKVAEGSSEEIAWIEGGIVGEEEEDSTEICDKEAEFE
jgi:hypothetical protein